MPIHEVVDQSTAINKKVDDLQLQLDTLNDQNTKLIDMMESVLYSGEGGHVSLPHPFERSPHPFERSTSKSAKFPSASPPPTSPSVI